MTDKIISDLESAVAVVGDMLLPVENGSGTFAASVDDIKDYVEENFDDAQQTVRGKAFLADLIMHKINASDPNNDIDFTAGLMTFEDGTGTARVAAMTKRLDANWSAGNGNGLLDTGSKGFAFYHLFAIYNPTTKAADFLASLAVVPTVLPSGFTKYMRIGRVVTDGSNNLVPMSIFFNILSAKGQIVVHQFSDVITTTTTIPYDDTKPQNNEGGQMMSSEILPRKATNIIRARHTGYYEASTPIRGIAAMFKGSAADAVAVGRNANISSQGTGGAITLDFQDIAGTTSRIAYAVRAGCESAGTITFNGSTGGGRRFGGAYNAHLIITESEI